MNNVDEVLMSKAVIKQIGIKKTAMLGLLCSYRLKEGQGVFVNMKHLEKDSPFRSKNTIRKHLKELDDLGLIEKLVRKNTKYYSVKESVFEDYMISCFPRNESEIGKGLKLWYLE